MLSPIFSGNPSIDRTAFMNWRINKEEIRSFYVMADGFLMGAVELAKSCLNNNEGKRADILIFPIFTNANHGIELYLKSMIWALNILLQSEQGLEKGHNIKQLYETTRARIKAYGGMIKVSSFNRDTKNLKDYIDELFGKIQTRGKGDKMDFSRYSIDKDNEYHFYVTEVGNVEIDLENFVHRFQEIHEKLELLSSILIFDELQQYWDQGASY